jgi:cell wall-associated NlpC family hydrolase
VEAERFLGVPYVWGGSSPAGLDRSGLVWLVYSQVGVDLPRTAAAQFAATQRISADQAQPGDLVFFANTYMPGISHVGLYLGNGQQINAPTEGQVVSVQPVFSGYWGEHLAGFGRVPRFGGGQA